MHQACVQGNGGCIRDVEAAEHAIRRDPTHAIAALPRQLPQPLALCTEHQCALCGPVDVLQRFLAIAALANAGYLAFRRED